MSLTFVFCLPESVSLILTIILILNSYIRLVKGLVIIVFLGMGLHATAQQDSLTSGNPGISSEISPNIYHHPVFHTYYDANHYKRRKWIVGGTNAVLWGGSAILLNEIWYKDYPRSAFHTFNDAGNWRYMDKLGHTYTAYQLATVEYPTWRWAGLKRKSAIWLSGGISWGYLMTVEVLDGFSEEWGFSWADVTANTAGSGLFVAQQLAWNEQRFQLKFGYKHSPYAALRPNILGSTPSERLLKDYNAQSYWLAVSPGLFFKESKFPKWIQVAVGYSADKMLKGDADNYMIDGFTYRSESEFGLSLDIDWAQLPIKKPWLKKLVKPLNTLKIPFPAVFWRGNTCYFGLL